MQQQTVRQHYISAGYLARFTFEGGRDSPFFVHSLDGRPVREDIPDNVGLERHYHDIDIPGFRPDHLESEFQKIEGPACALFRTLSANPGRPLEAESEIETATVFFAVQAARVPLSKEKYRRLIVDSSRSFMEAVAYSPEFFGRVMAAARRQGVVVDSVEQSWLREGLDSRHIATHADEAQVAVGILRLAHSILEVLDGMHCTLLYSDGPEWFVCSDYPVGLFYSLSAAGDPLENPDSIEYPAVQPLCGTMYMPLAYNVALAIHRFDNVPAVQRADRRMVGIVNTVTISHARRFICSPTPEFTCVLPNRELGTAKDAIEALRSFRECDGKQ